MPDAAPVSFSRQSRGEAAGTDGGWQGGAGPEMPATRPATAPANFHVLAKPTGPICNLDCEYCFFLSKEALYPGDRFRMSDDAARRRTSASTSGPSPTARSPWRGRAASPR